MKLRKLFALACVCQLAYAGLAYAVESVSTQKILGLPDRLPSALSGSEFIQKISNQPAQIREKLIVDEVLSGNIPESQRHLVPIDRIIVSGPYKGKALRYWVLPDYLAIGSDQDFVRVPLNMPSILLLEKKLNLSLPTTLMVDDIYDQAQVRLQPTTLQSSREMTSVQYFSFHNDLVQSQLQQSEWKPGMLVAGHKKDVVQSVRLAEKPEAVAIYGWHSSSHNPIQPLSTVHGAKYADYSHGVRFVSNIVEINHQYADLRSVLSRKMQASMATKQTKGIEPRS